MFYVYYFRHTQMLLFDTNAGNNATIIILIRCRSQKHMHSTTEMQHLMNLPMFGWAFGLDIHETL